jgi:glycosyltransferase involved in cell wall biosynthesis
MGLFGSFSGNFPRKVNAPNQPEPLGPVPKRVVSVPHIWRGRVLGQPAGFGKSPIPSPLPPSSAPIYSVPPEGSPQVRSDGTPEVNWYGIIHGYSGYAKANREILKRISTSVRISLLPDIPWNPEETNPEAIGLLEKHRGIEAGAGAPRIVFHPPKTEGKAKNRAIWTMMETDPVHPDMIRIMNENYEECWTPTLWNAQAFQKSGLKIPIHIMPLGIDPDVYRPDADPVMQEAVLSTTQEAGKAEFPSGFLFICVCEPTFRKGLDVLSDAFEEAFHDDPEAGLVIATTGYSCESSPEGKSWKSRIWTLAGRFSESEMASLYRSCQVYVSASRGEGWNLPLCESAACGLPLILSRVSTHPELVPEEFGYFFDPDSSTVFPDAGELSPWFEGMQFPDYGPGARRRLSSLLKEVKRNYEGAKARAENCMKRMRRLYTWDASAKNVEHRINALVLR